MATYLDMINRIGDESLRSDMANQIKLCIQDAIGHYEVERFWFNQFRDRTFATAAGQEFYGEVDQSDIPHVLEFDAVTSDCRVYALAALEGRLRAARGLERRRFRARQPTHYAYWGSQIRLYPVPDAAYQIRLSGLFKLPTLVADGDVNAWTEDAEEVVRHRAKAILYSQYLRDDANAARATALEMMALERLSTTTARRLSSGGIRPSL
ncbi:MAG: hypothetical protein HC869_24255 [Rhodospirillales bacterium]|nr:hypothetical protein [Rhodospirillales bacterium]